MQQSVGKDMAAFDIAAELNLVDGHEIGADFLRHRLDRADPIGGAVGHDAFLTGDQRHDRRATCGDDAVVNLARQQTQRQADHPGAVRQHAVNRKMGFSGIRRP